VNPHLKGWDSLANYAVIDNSGFPGHSLIAKLIVHGSDRAEVISRMKRALSMFVVEGISTTIPLHERIMEDKDFQAGRFNTTFLTTFL
jgi:acetyl-CoA carboxylase biotin carboxylase subunit